MPAKQKKRRYSGQSFEARQAERREKLVEAAVKVAGQVGLEGASVAAICAEAGLTARYFYESFPSRDEIFVAAYRMAQDRLLYAMGEVRDARNPVRGALKGFFTAIATHPGVARVFLIDLETHGPSMRMASFEGMTKLSKAFAVKATHPLMVVGIIGAIVDIAKRWIESDFAEPVDTVVEIALPFTKLRN